MPIRVAPGRFRVSVSIYPLAQSICCRLRGRRSLRSIRSLAGSSVDSVTCGVVNHFGRVRYIRSLGRFARSIRLLVGSSITSVDSFTCGSSITSVECLRYGRLRLPTVCSAPSTDGFSSLRLSGGFRCVVLDNFRCAEQATLRAGASRVGGVQNLRPVGLIT